ncbi:unnamed protein product [Cylindrotheca closterium]|uniref:DUF6824 domain-containing protein n=1 Tax=Cylindrotheca closterium TaxID=2856 RepID=A0AAD2CFW8_9STRA|nr:unnamed protein product [Cylindrotheca closterium]
MQFVNPVHTLIHLSPMNIDNKLPFPERLPDASYSSDTAIRVHNQNTHKRPLTTTTYQPTGQDIICGRGRGSFLHEGNKVYLSLLRRNVHAYLHAKKRVEKSVIISTVVSSLKERGFRFLKQDDRNQRWYELSESDCYDRTAHAIRDLIRKQKGRNKKPLSKHASSRSPSPSNSDISVDSHKTDGPSKQSTNTDTPISLTCINEQSNSNQLSSSSPSNVVGAIANLPNDADSFDDKITEIPSEMMSPTDSLKTAGGFDAFFELEPDDFGRVLSQLEAEKQERRASWESK